MWKYTAKRIALILVTAFIILSITYLLMKLLPVFPPAGSYGAQLSFYTQQMNLGYMTRVANQGIADVILVNPDSGEQIFFAYKPVLTQYGVWLTNIFSKWDWGTSATIKVGDSAIAIIGSKLPYTIKVNIISTIIAIPLGFALGIWAAVKKNKLSDNVISTLVMVFISVPSFVLISFLISGFAYGADVLPSTWPADSAALAERVKGYIIPVSTLALGSIASFTRYTRAELTEVMSNEFMLLARTKGLTKGQAIIRHALRNSGVVLFPMVIGEFVGVFGGSMILEKLYSIPGIGSLFVDAITQRDYNVVMVVMAVYTLIGLTANLVVDLSYGWIDPRIRMGAKR